MVQLVCALNLHQVQVETRLENTLPPSSPTPPPPPQPKKKKLKQKKTNKVHCGVKLDFNAVLFRKGTSMQSKS